MYSSIGIPSCATNSECITITASCCLWLIRWCSWRKTVRLSSRWPFSALGMALLMCWDGCREIDKMEMMASFPICIFLAGIRQKIFCEVATAAEKRERVIRFTSFFDPALALLQPKWIQLIRLKSTDFFFFDIKWRLISACPGKNPVMDHLLM